jgi:hypothetical protein
MLHFPECPPVCTFKAMPAQDFSASSKKFVSNFFEDAEN